MATFQERLKEAIGPEEKVTLTRYPGADTDFIKVEFETEHDTLGLLLHPQHLAADAVTPGKLVSAIEDAKAHIQSAVDVVTRTRENAVLVVEVSNDSP